MGGGDDSTCLNDGEGQEQNTGSFDSRRAAPKSGAERTSLAQDDKGWVVGMTARVSMTAKVKSRTQGPSTRDVLRQNRAQNARLSLRMTKDEGMTARFSLRMTSDERCG
jgi:hypothetical protein